MAKKKNYSCSELPDAMHIPCMTPEQEKDHNKKMDEAFRMIIEGIQRRMANDIDRLVKYIK